MTIQFRWGNKRDLPRVLEIEKDVFEFPFDEADFLRVLRKRNTVLTVAIDGSERLCGYALYAIFEARFHILNIAVDPHYQRRGVGAAMIDTLKDKLSANRRKRITAEVRESNVDAQLFFKATGFRAVTILRDFYDETDDDAYVMQYRLPVESPVPDGRINCGGGR